MAKMSIEKAVAILKNGVNAKTYEEQIEARNMGIEALEKQIPKKVDSMNCCPICNTYGKDDNDVNGEYCSNCGQKLCWG